MGSKDSNPAQQAGDASGGRDRTGQPAYNRAWRAIARFRDGLKLEGDPGGTGADGRIEEALIAQVGSPAKRLRRLVPKHVVGPVFDGLTAVQLNRLVERARDEDPRFSPPDYRSFYAWTTSSRDDARALADELNGWDEADAWVEPTATQSDVVGGDPGAPEQRYRDVAPLGINVDSLRDRPGALGQGQRLIDIEGGWTLEHEDLRETDALLAGEIAGNWRAHGTAVLGVVCGVPDNDRGGRGIATAAGADVISPFQLTAVGVAQSVPNAILQAVWRFLTTPRTDPDGADLLLLELQVDDETWGSGIPVEVDDSTFWAIRLATALGIGVVEPAGNGYFDLDLWYPPEGPEAERKILSRRDAAFRDSGAIVVGASTATKQHELLVKRDGGSLIGATSYGSRVDCHAWGESVFTSHSNVEAATDLYTSDFSGTSSAAAIVAGAALAVQGVVTADGGEAFKPTVLRAVLSNPATGTKATDEKGRNIGAMPDVGKVIEKVVDGGMLPSDDMTARGAVLGEGSAMSDGAGLEVTGPGFVVVSGVDLNRTGATVEITPSGGSPQSFEYETAEQAQIVAGFASQPGAELEASAELVQSEAALATPSPGTETYGGVSLNSYSSGLAEVVINYDNSGTPATRPLTLATEEDAVRLARALTTSESWGDRMQVRLQNASSVVAVVLNVASSHAGD